MTRGRGELYALTLLWRPITWAYGGAMSKKDGGRAETAVWYFVGATFALVAPVIFGWETASGLSWTLSTIGLGLIVLGFIVWRSERRQRRDSKT